MEEPHKRKTDTLKNWAVVIGPAIGVAFGAGVVRGSLEGIIQSHTSQIAETKAQIVVIQKTIADQDIGAATVRSELSSTNQRLARIEDLVQQTLFQVKINKR